MAGAWGDVPRMTAIDDAYALEMDLASVPSLCARFGLSFRTSQQPSAPFASPRSDAIPDDAMTPTLRSLARTDAPAAPRAEDRLQSPFSPSLTRALEQTEAAFWRALWAAAPAEAVRTAGLAHASFDGADVFSAAHVDVLALNKVLGLGLASPAGDAAYVAAVLDRLVARYAALGVPRFFVQLSPAAPAALFQGLAARGFVPYNRWTKLMRPVAARLDAPPSALRVEAIGPERADVFGGLVAPAFGWPPPLQAALAACVGRRGWRHYLAYDGAVAIAAAACYVHDGYAYFGPAVTAAPYRRRGAQTTLVARRLRDASALGCHTAVVDTAEHRPDRPVASFRTLLRMGFTVAYQRPNYLYSSDQPSAPAA